MELQYFGANCVRISTKKASIIIDDNLSKLGLKSVTKTGDLAMFTQGEGDSPADVKTVIAQPGEYEISDTSIQGVAARGHMDENGQQTATIFRVFADDIRVVALGHVFADLNDEQLEALGSVDVLFIPVGGNGYTLDGVEALKLIKKIEPRLVIPTHFADKAIKYEVPQASLDEALKELAMEPKETVPKLKIKASDLPIDTQLVILERQ